MTDFLSDFLSFSSKVLRCKNVRNFPNFFLCRNMKRSENWAQSNNVGKWSKMSGNPYDFNVPKCLRKFSRKTERFKAGKIVKISVSGLRRFFASFLTFLFLTVTKIFWHFSNWPPKKPDSLFLTLSIIKKRWFWSNNRYRD